MKKRPITSNQRAILAALYAAGQGRGIALKPRFRADAARLIAAGYARRIGAGTGGAIWALTYKGIRTVEAMAAADRPSKGVPN